MGLLPCSYCSSGVLVSPGCNLISLSFKCGFISDSTVGSCFDPVNNVLSNKDVLERTTFALEILLAVLIFL